MIIAIPVEQKDPDACVSSTFGRSGYFLLFDSQTNDFHFLESTFATGQSAGIRAAQLMIDNHVGVLITNRCGENAMRLLPAGNIQVYQTIAGSARDNLERCLAGTLSRL